MKGSEYIGPVPCGAQGESFLLDDGRIAEIPGEARGAVLFEAPGLARPAEVLGLLCLVAATTQALEGCRCRATS